ncbi:cation:proton antiporter [Verrucomicrobiaceae bacterium N1E253]|uniref:Cation:proton antiporter n=1 Tax=Oceaniferula marina TaxID=2748318 RepID=A0A851GDT4_9BACT|nr:cation:proton antiporter [Oceaniferula marina]NWK55713.1 cation:proton antiporter [Oceaniferula marina]
METTHAAAITIAFLLGLGARSLKLPPMVGLLAAGFILGGLGFESGKFIYITADLGVTLLLFTIGLKLKVKDLLATEVWASASSHMLLMVAMMTLGINVLGVTGLTMLANLDLSTSLLIAFALSFSSTVFAVKVLEDQGESSSLHARVAIGMLIIQDIVAVLFMAWSKGEPPSPWAILLILLIPARGLLNKLAVRCGHGELLILYGMMLAFLGSWVFEFLGVKGDFGALLLGMLLAPYSKAEEMSKILMSFKDIMLVCFFLSIGLDEVPTLQDFAIAALLLLFIPIKMVGYFALLTLFKLRARTALLSTLALANYSEFGLIIATVAIKAGWLDSDWITILAISVSLSFIIAAPLNNYGKELYRRWHKPLMRFQRKQRIPGDEILHPGNAEILIFGMGRVGAKAYKTMADRYGEDKVIGIDNDHDVVKSFCAQGWNMILGDPTDVDFWERKSGTFEIKVIMLAMKNHQENKQAASLIRKQGFPGCLSATASHEDEIQELRDLGVDAAYNIYGSAGEAFANHICTYQGDTKEPKA